MDIDKSIKIRCGGEIYLNLSELNFFQKKLKTITDVDFKKLKESIIKDGIPIGFHVWWDEKKKQWDILDGHHRYLALKELEKEGWFVPALPCNIVLAKNKREAAKVVLISNTRYARMNQESVSNYMIDFELQLPDIELLDLIDIDMKDFGIEENQEGNEGNCDPDDVPENVETKAKIGDLFELGNHRLICGDSTSLENIERLMNGEKADMVFTDPPYKLETEGGCKGNIGKHLKKQGNEISFIADFDPKDFLDILPFVFEKDKINSYIFCNKELLPDYLLWARENKYSFNVLVWKKPNAIPIRDSHRPDIEYLILFRKSAIWNYGLNGINYSRCLEYGREKGLHPTMKPIELICNEIQISSNKYSLIVDFFGGSGSTLIACEKTNRKCFMSELDPHYCDVIIQRFQAFSDKKAYLIKDDDSKILYDDIN